MKIHFQQFTACYWLHPGKWGNMADRAFHGSCCFAPGLRCYRAEDSRLRFVSVVAELRFRHSGYARAKAILYLYGIHRHETWHLGSADYLVDKEWMICQGLYPSKASKVTNGGQAPAECARTMD